MWVVLWYFFLLRCVLWRMWQNRFVQVDDTFDQRAVLVVDRRQNKIIHTVIHCDILFNLTTIHSESRSIWSNVSSTWTNRFCHILHKTHRRAYSIHYYLLRWMFFLPHHHLQQHPHHLQQHSHLHHHLHIPTNSSEWSWAFLPWTGWQPKQRKTATSICLIDY